jgi:hypothetical protein
MEINTLNVSGYELIRAGGKIEKGAAAGGTFTTSSNTLFSLDAFWQPLFHLTGPGNKPIFSAGWAV